jgi:hypothetical protein
MDNDKVNEVLRKMAQQLDGLGHKPVRNPPEKPLPDFELDGAEVALQHAHWMCIETLAMPPEKLEKKFRWLGFIQCILWMTGIQTVDEARKDNMPAGEEFRR